MTTTKILKKYLDNLNNFSNRVYYQLNVLCLQQRIIEITLNFTISAFRQWDLKKIKVKMMRSVLLALKSEYNLTVLTFLRLQIVG